MSSTKHDSTYPMPSWPLRAVIATLIVLLLASQCMVAQRPRPVRPGRPARPDTTATVRPVPVMPSEFPDSMPEAIPAGPEEVVSEQFEVADDSLHFTGVADTMAVVQDRKSVV